MDDCFFCHAGDGNLADDGNLDDDGPMGIEPGDGNQADG